VTDDEIEKMVKRLSEPQRKALRALAPEVGVAYSPSKLRKLKVKEASLYALGDRGLAAPVGYSGFWHITPEGLKVLEALLAEMASKIIAKPILVAKPLRATAAAASKGRAG
jgi:hypothetical protein